MTNVNEITLKSVMDSISGAAPILILLCGLGTFGIVGFFQYDYYSTIFYDDFGERSHLIGLSIAVFTELIRFVLLVSSVRDFSDDKKFNGWLGLAASVFLVWHDVTTNINISDVLESNHRVLFSGILNFLVVLGLVLEIRLILTIAKGKKSMDDVKL